MGFLATCVYLRVRLGMATQRKFSLRLLATTCESVWPGLYTLCEKLFSLSSLGSEMLFASTVEPRFNEPLFNEVLDKTNENLRPGQNYSKMYGIEPRYNVYGEFLDITNIIRKPKRKIYLDITN